MKTKQVCLTVMAIALATCSGEQVEQQTQKEAWLSHTK